jgi:hypothetical protein
VTDFQWISPGFVQGAYNYIPAAVTKVKTIRKKKEETVTLAPKWALRNIERI